MLFSVLTPSFNYGRYIDDALLSVERQEDVAGVEHIVQDGASTDDTVQHLQARGESLRWVSEQDAGQSDALNRAMRVSRGDVIGWLNADEFYLPGALAAVAEIFSTQPSV